MAGGLNTGDWGGQCVKYAGETYFGKKFGVMKAAEVWNASTVTQLSGPQSGCVAVWTGGDGHVGVVESYTSKDKLTFSDSNRNWDELVVKDVNISQKTMEGIRSGFKGYVKFK